LHIIIIIIISNNKPLDLNRHLYRTVLVNVLMTGRPRKRCLGNIYDDCTGLGHSCCLRRLLNDYYR